MLRQQGRGLLGQLRPQRHPLLGQAPQQLRIGDVGELDRGAGAQRIADEPRLRLGVGLLGARGGELAVVVGELLAGERLVVGADEQAGLAAVTLDLGFGSRHLGAQLVDLAREPLAGGARLGLLGGALQHQILRRHRIGDLGGELGVGGFELDDDDARFLRLVGVEPVLEALEHALLGRHAHRIAGDADEAEQRLDERRAVQHRIEFRPLAELQFLDDVARQIARENELDLARHGFLVDRGARLAGLLGFRPQKDVLARLDQDPRLGFVFRGDQADRDEGDGGRPQRQPQDRDSAAPQRASERAEIELFDCGLHDAKPRGQLRTCTHH